MFQQTQDDDYIQIILNRLESNSPLVWTSQFCSFIQEFNKKQSVKSINDIGCQVGQFYKSIKIHNLDFLEYNGFDIEDIYLKEFEKKYIECKNKLKKIDISDQQPQKVDVSIISATLEHIENYEKALNNILNSSNKLVLIRTFLGEFYKFDKIKKSKAILSYIIQQFSFDNIFKIINDNGFDTDIIRDKYTDSLPKLIGMSIENNPIVRTQYIVVCERR